MRSRKHWRSGGFTYLGLVILVAIIGLAGAATLKVDAIMRRAQAEQELLETGAAFVAAFDSYASATPQGQPPQPPTLGDLLTDRRFPEVRHHLRKIFIDPVTGKAEWGIIYGKDHAGVAGVYSLSHAKPLKRANFDGRFADFDGKEHLSEWKFTGGAKSPLPASGRPRLHSVVLAALLATARCALHIRYIFCIAAAVTHLRPVLTPPSVRSAQRKARCTVYRWNF